MLFQCLYICIRKDTQYNFSLKFIKTCNLTYDLSWRMITCAWEECVFCCCWVVFCNCPLSLFVLMAPLSLTIPHWLCLSVAKSGVSKCSLLLLCCRQFLHSSLNVRSIYLGVPGWLHITFLSLDWSKIVYNDLLCLLLYFSKSVLSDVSIATSAFYKKISTCMNYLSIPPLRLSVLKAEVSVS